MKRLFLLLLSALVLTGFHVSQTFSQVTQVRVETAPDGSGGLVQTQSLAAGSSITVYAIARDSSNAFVSNVAADSIVLQGINGGVVPGDLVVALDRRSAVFTAHVSGSAQIRADSGLVPSTPSGTITTIFGAATRLTISQEPSASASAGVPFSQQPVIRIEDAYGNLVSSDNSTVVTAARFLGTGSLSGTISATASGGVVSGFSLSHTVSGTINIRFTSVPSLIPDTSVNIVVSPGSASKLAFIQQPTSATAGVTISPAVTVQLRDQYDNNVLLSGEPVALTIASGTGTLSGTTTQNTNASGLATFSNLSINLAGLKTLSASRTGLTSATSSLFSIATGSPSRLNISTQPSPTATAGVVFAQQPVVRIEDVFGNVITSDNSTVITAARLGGTGTLQGTITATASAGVATFTNLLHNTATTITIRFTSGILTAATSDNIVVSAAAPTRVVFVTQPSNAVAGASITPAVTAQLLDAFGNSSLVNGTSVQIALASGTGTLSGTTTRSTSNGLATFNDLSVNLVGSKSLTVTSVGLTPATSNSFVISAGTASRLSIVVEPPSSTTAGSIFSPQPVVHVLDSSGNLVTSDNSTLVKATRLTGTGVLQGTDQVTVSGGIATFSNLAYTIAENITIRFTSTPSLTPDTSGNILVRPGVATKLVFIQQPTGVAAGAIIAPPVTIQLRDANNNNVDSANVSVLMTLTSGTGTLSGTTARLTSATGLATFDDLSINITGTKALTASAAGFTSAASNNFTIGANTPTQLNISVQPPASVSAGVVFSPAPVVRIEDVNGNLITTDNSTVVTATRLSGSGTLQGTVSATASGGLAMFSNLFHTTSGTISIRFTSVPTLTAVTSTNVVVNPAVVNKVVFVQPPTNASAGASIAPPVTVQLQDTFSNNVSANGVAIGMALSSGTGVLGGTTPRTTNASGLATFSDLTINVAGSKALTASSIGLTSAVSPAFTISAGSAQNITATAGTPQSATVLTAFGTNLQATVRDTLGNPISGITVTFTSPSSGASGTFVNGLVSTTATSNASGVATASTFTANGTSGSYSVTASVAGVSTPATFTLTNNPGAAATIATVAGTPQSTNVNTAFATNFQVVVRDANSNPVSGVTVTFNKPGSGASGNFAAGVNTAVTNASGIATAAVFTANGAVGSYTVTATVVGVASPANFLLTNISGPPASIAAGAGTPQSATVNNAFATNLQVQVLDAVGNPVNGATVTFTKPGTGASGNFAGGVNTAITNTSGLATAPPFTANTVAGQYTVSASVSGVVQTASFSLTNTAGVPTTISASAGASQSAQVGTAFGTAFQAAVKDSFNNVVPGATVTFTAPTTGARGTFTGGLSTLNAVTNASGIATATTFTANTTAGTYAVSATASGVSTPATYSLTNTAGTPTQIFASQGATQSTQINTTFALGLQATVRDAFNNPVNGVIVTFTAPASGASGTFTGGLTTITATSGSNGIAIAPDFRANSTAGTYSVSASATGIGTNATYSLTNLPGAASAISANAGTPQSAQVNTAFATALQAKVVDSGNNPVSGVNVTFTAPTTAGVPTGTFAGGLSSVTVATNVSGLATAPTFTANTKSGQFTVSASVTGIATPAIFLLTNTSGAAATIAATVGTPQNVQVGTAFPSNLQVIVQDAFTNPVSGVVVTFAAPLTGASGTFAGGVNTATTNASGLATAAVFTANGTAGSYTVAASASGIATSANFSLTNTAGPPASVTASAGTPQSAQVGGVFATNFKAIVRDASNNPVSGITVTFSAPASGPTGRWGGQPSITATTNISGEATATAFTANTTAGSYNVSASVTGVASPALFALTNLPGAAASITATAGTPQSTQISTAFPVNLQVLVKDAFENVVPNVTVTFAPPASGASGTFAGGNTATTGANGVAIANVFVANFIAGSYAVNATASGVAAPATFNLTNTAGTPASITATAGTPQAAMIGTAFATNLQATVKDGANNPVPGVSVTFTAPGGGPSGTFTGGSNVTSAITGANGIATAAVFTANMSAGTYNVTATVQNVSTPAQFTLTNQEGPPGSITVVAGTPQSTVVGTAFATNLQVMVKDGANNPVPNSPVTFIVPTSGASASFAGGVNVVTTSSSGIATAVVLTANTIAGSYQISASATGVSTPAIFSMTNTPGSASNILAIAGTPQSAQIGTAYATNLKAKVTDASNNPIGNVTVTFLIPGSGASGTFAGGVNTAVTDSAGIATARTLTANLVAGQFTVNASASGVGAPAQFFLTNTSGAASTIVAASGTPQSTVVGTAFATNLSATVRDGQNNPVPGAVVTFSVPPGTGGPRFAGDSVAVNRQTNSSGIATAPQLTAGTLASVIQASASVSGVSTSALFQLTQLPGAVASITATAGTPQSAQISTAFATNLQSTLRDAFNNPIPGVSVTFTAPTSGPSGTFVSGSNVYTGQTNASGVIIASTFSANNVAGSYAVNATVSGVSTPAGFSLTNLSAAAASITVTQGTPQSAVVNTAFATPMAVLVRDAANNPVSGVIVTFTAPSTGASGKFSGGVRSVNVTTTSSGTATAPSFTADTLAGSYNVTATVAGVPTPGTFALTNAVGAPATLTAVNPNPRSAQVGAPFVIGFAVTVRDAYQNSVSGVTVTYTVNPVSGASGTFAGGANTAVTNASGVATPATFTANTVAGCYTINATVSGIAVPLVFQLCNTAGPAQSISLVAGSGTSTSVGSQFPNPFRYSVKDAFNNPVPNVNVTLNVPSTGASAIVNPNPAVTDASGVAQTVATANNIAGEYSVSATVSGVSSPALVTLTNVPRVAKTATITQGSPQATQVGTAFATRFQILVADTFSNPVPNVTVTFTAPSSGPSGGFDGSPTYQTQTTAAGLATASTFTANGTPGVYSVSATIPGISAAQEFILTNLTGPPGSIAATQGTPQSTTARTSYAVRFKATVKDAQNNPVANEQVTFSAPTTQPTGKFNGTSSQIVVNTDAQGVAEAPVFIADSVAGQFSVNATAGLVSSPAVYSLTIQPRVAKNVIASGGTPQNAQVSTAFALPLQTTVRDTFGNPVPNVRVRYSYPSSGPSGTFAGNVDTAITNASGVATSAIFVANITSGSYVVSGSVQGVTSAANFQLTNMAGQPGSIAATAGTPQTAQINTAFATRFSVIVKDAANNPVSGVTVTFTNPPQTEPSGRFANDQNTAVTGSNGVATAAIFTANQFSGDYAVTASAQGVSTPARFELTNTASSPASVLATAGTPQSAQVNSPFVTRLKVIVKDAANNPVNGISVRFRVPSNGASGTFTNNDSTAVTNSTGEAEAVTLVANSIAGTYSVFGLVAGVSTPAEFRLSNTTGSPGRIFATAGANQQAQVNALFDTLMRVRIVDSSSNPVSGVLVTFTAPATGASGTFAGGSRTATATTDNSGFASAPAFTANTIAGSYQVTASAAGVATSALFSLVNRPAALNRFAVEAEAGGSIGLQLATIPFNVKISARDAFGNTVSTFTGTVNISSTGVLSSGGGATPAFESGSLIRRVIVRKAATNITLTALRSGGSETGSSNQFSVNNPLPTVTSMSPDSGNLMQNVVIRISGTNFIDSVTTISVGSGITVNGLTVDSSSQLRANLTIAGNAVVGPRNVIVSNSPPGGGTSQALQFRVTLPVPLAPELVGGPQNGARNQDTMATLWWRSSSLAVAYHLQISTSPSFTLPMFFNDSTLTDTSKTLVLPTNSTTGIVYYWRVRAKNGTGAGTFSATKSFSTIPSYPSSFALNVNVPFATRNNPGDYSATEYRIIGLPGDATSIRLRDVMTGSHNVDWVAYWDNGASSSNFIAFDGTSTFNFSTGRAFWILRKGALAISRSVQTAILDGATRSVNIPLHSGWNLITNPFITNIPWTAVDTANGLGLATPWKFEGTFSQATTLEPYKGFYFDNTRSLTNLKVPYGNFASAALDKSPTSIASRDRWSIGIQLAVDDLIDNSASFGTNPAARSGLDSLEYRKPQALGSVPSVYFSRPDWDQEYSTFATDIRPAYDDVQTWSFEVQAPVRKESELFFDGLSSIPENFKAFLIDNRQERFVNLFEQARYKFVSPFSNSEFRVVVGTEERVSEVLSTVLPKEFALGTNFPNPFNPTTTIPIALPHAADVSIRIYNILGEEVRNVYTGTLDAGRHFLTWDGRSKSGEAVASGMYIVRFTTNAGKAFTSKMLLMK